MISHLEPSSTAHAVNAKHFDFNKTLICAVTSKASLIMSPPTLPPSMIPSEANTPTLTGNKHLATIYAGHPDRDKEMPPIMKSQAKDLLDRTVVIQNEKGFYLHEDGRTMGDDSQFAIKFQLHADNVERQLRKAKAQYGVN